MPEQALRDGALLECTFHYARQLPMNHLWFARKFESWSDPNQLE